MEEEKLIEAIENIRRDKHDPWRYLLFTFFNGIAQGVGIALGTTLVLGIIVYVLTVILSKLVNFPVLGYYFGEIMKLIDVYLKQGVRVR